MVQNIVVSYQSGAKRNIRKITRHRIELYAAEKVHTNTPFPIFEGFKRDQVDGRNSTHPSMELMHLFKSQKQMSIGSPMIILNGFLSVII